MTANAANTIPRPGTDLFHLGDKLLADEYGVIRRETMLQFRDKPNGVRHFYVTPIALRQTVYYHHEANVLRAKRELPPLRD